MRAEIVIPCFNEAGNLSALIDECYKIIHESKGRINFILVNNGSLDSTNKIFSENSLESKGIRFITCAVNKGYGGGIVAGLNQTTAEIVGWTHADLQTPLIDCLRGLECIEKGHSFAKGMRNGRPLIDRFFSIGMGVYESCLFRAPLWEVNAQPTLFTREFFLTWKNVPTDFSLDLYALVMAHKSQESISRFKVHFLPRVSGSSHWNHGFLSRLHFVKRIVNYSLILRRELR